MIYLYQFMGAAQYKRIADHPGDYSNEPSIVVTTVIGHNEQAAREHLPEAYNEGNRSEWLLIGVQTLGAS